MGRFNTTFDTDTEKNECVGDKLEEIPQHVQEGKGDGTYERSHEVWAKE